ncbi:unnamed protein product [Soboliphyme baturini]|uniref:Non-specific serine/threonine protein kinase n=1 Tax=Soboliphyme baturini TaxID=241478 RepID=A0A183IKV3_9BILA|nr:unnamed protein product [Soboliphyme baturini]
MNIVRKISSRLSSTNDRDKCSSEAEEVVEENGASSSGGSGSWDSSALPSDRILAIMHMRKLFSNLLRNPPPPRDIDQKLFPIVALLSKLTESFTPSEFSEKFKEVPQLTTWLGRHLVQEIRRRASSQSTPTAAIAIFTYFQKSNHGRADYGHYGWMMLRSLSYLLSSGCEAAKGAACKASLPSTLVKCLYLFFDLPDMTVLSISEDDCEAVRQVFLEVLRLLLHTTAGTEELIRKDDLLLLFSGASSWCPEHNRIWRGSTIDLLMILCSNIHMSFVLNYVHAKKAVAMFVNNVRQIQEAMLSERVEMIGCLLCILKDSALASDTLLNDFLDVQGYQFLTDFIIDNEECPARDDQDSLRNLLFMISSLVTSHFTELKPLVTNTLFTLPGFELPQPAGDGRSVKNLKAFEVLENVFLRSRQNYVLSSVLDVVHSIVCSDQANYFILEPRSFLGRFVETLDSKSDDIRQKVLDLVEYVPFHLNFIPSKELIAISMLIKTERNYDSILIILQSLSRILHHSSILKDVFREVGLLEVLTSLLLSFSFLIEADEGKISK